MVYMVQQGWNFKIDPPIFTISRKYIDHCAKILTIFDKDEKFAHQIPSLCPNNLNKFIWSVTINVVDTICSLLNDKEKHP